MTPTWAGERALELALTLNEQRMKDQNDEFVPDADRILEDAKKFKAFLVEDTNGQ